MTAVVRDVTDEGNRIVEFECGGSFYETLDKLGQMPLPPYIHEKLQDKERYQTVYSRELGSAAAPTAGLHFTKELMERIRQKGIKIGYVTLHVGLGTFRPVKVDDVTKHHMHSEHYQITQETADLINETKKKGGRVISGELILYGVQLVFNFLWCVFFFGLGAYLFSFIWLLALLGLVTAMTIAFYGRDKLAGLLQIPYILWLCFAGYLNLFIYILNQAA